MRKSFKERTIAAIVGLFQLAALSFATPAKADFIDDLDSLILGKNRATTQPVQQQQPPFQGQRSFSHTINTARTPDGGIVATYPATSFSPSIITLTKGSGEKIVVTEEKGAGEANIYGTLPILDKNLAYVATVRVKPSDVPGHDKIEFGSLSFAGNVPSSVNIKAESLEARKILGDVAAARSAAHATVSSLQQAPTLENRGYFAAEMVPGLGDIDGVQHVNRRSIILETPDGGVKVSTTFFDPHLKGGKLAVSLNFPGKTGESYRFDKLILLVQNYLADAVPGLERQGINQRAELADAMLIAILSDIAEMGNKEAVSDLIKNGRGQIASRVFVVGDFSGATADSLNKLIGMGLPQIFEKYLGPAPMSAAPTVTPPQAGVLGIVAAPYAPPKKTVEQRYAPPAKPFIVPDPAQPAKVKEQKPAEPVAPSSLERKAGNKQKTTTTQPPAPGKLMPEPKAKESSIPPSSDQTPEVGKIITVKKAGAGFYSLENWKVPLSTIEKGQKVLLEAETWDEKGNRWFIVKLLIGEKNGKTMCMTGQIMADSLLPEGVSSPLKQPPQTKAPATTPPTKKEAPPSNEVRGKVAPPSAPTPKTPDSAPPTAAPPATPDQATPKAPPPPPQPSFLSIFTRT